MQGFNYDRDKMNGLWHVLYERGIICSNKNIKVRVNGKGKPKHHLITVRAEQKITALMERLDDTLEYIDSMCFLYGTHVAYDFYNFINYEYIVIKLYPLSRTF